MILSLYFEITNCTIKILQLNFTFQQNNFQLESCLIPKEPNNHLRVFVQTLGAYVDSKINSLKFYNFF